MILGVDPGMTGALAFYNKQELFIFDMPVLERNKTKRVDCHALQGIITQFTPLDHAYIEQVNAFNMGATGAYNFGWSCGVVEAVLACCGVPYTYVTPVVWKKALGCPKDKDGARMRANQLFPLWSDNWALKKHDGRAEAALIAYYGLNV